MLQPEEALELLHDYYDGSSPHESGDGGPRQEIHQYSQSACGMHVVSRHCSVNSKQSQIANPHLKIPNAASMIPVKKAAVKNR